MLRLFQIKVAVQQDRVGRLRGRVDLGLWCVKDHSMKLLGTCCQEGQTIISTVSASCVAMFLCVCPRLPDAPDLMLLHLIFGSYLAI